MESNNNNKYQHSPDFDAAARPQNDVSLALPTSLCPSVSLTLAVCSALLSSSAYLLSPLADFLLLLITLVVFVVAAAIG